MEDKQMPEWDIQNVNFDLLRRKCVFQTGRLEYTNELDESSKATKKPFKSCKDMFDILPIKLRE